jgi:hypothetical protein
MSKAVGRVGGQAFFQEWVATTEDKQTVWKEKASESCPNATIRGAPVWGGGMMYTPGARK